MNREWSWSNFQYNFKSIINCNFKLIWFHLIFKTIIGLVKVKVKVKVKWCNVYLVRNQLRAQTRTNWTSFKVFRKQIVVLSNFLQIEWWMDLIVPNFLTYCQSPASPRDWPTHINWKYFYIPQHFWVKYCWRSVSIIQHPQLSIVTWVDVSNIMLLDTPL